MYRQAIEQLIKWKNEPNHKPLIIEGARQVGKTYLMKAFGKEYYEDTVYINFDHNETMERLFQPDLDVHRIITGLEIYSGKRISEGDVLLIFDEVQEVPNALAALKYFNENAPGIDLLCAGSMLGIALHEGTSFPVGKVEFLKLSPMSFAEFLKAHGDENILNLIKSHDSSMLSIFANKISELLKQYFFVGGMPEVVLEFCDTGDFDKVRIIQHRIIAAYEQDFSKHAPNEMVPRIRYVWESIPSQLSRENKKFVYGLVREGARAREYESAIMWLSDCGLIHTVHRIRDVKLPLKAYEDLKAFKIYLVDVGLLSCMAGLDAKTLLEGNDIFVEFKGALTEQYVLQELSCIDELKDKIYYYTNDRSTSEIDFIISRHSKIIPIEVKAETNLRAKSLSAFHEKFNIKTSVRTSMSDFSIESWLINLPLYMESEILNILDKRNQEKLS